MEELRGKLTRLLLWYNLFLEDFYGSTIFYSICVLSFFFFKSAIWAREFSEQMKSAVAEPM